MRWITVFVLLGIATCSIPRLTLFPVFREGNRLIPLIEKYREERGSYPDSLDQLGVKLQFGKSEFRGIDYRVNEDRTEFILVCFAFGRTGGFGGTREVYNSTTEYWRTLD